MVKVAETLKWLKQMKSTHRHCKKIPNSFSSDPIKMGRLISNKQKENFLKKLRQMSLESEQKSKLNFFEKELEILKTIFVISESLDPVQLRLK